MRQFYKRRKNGGRTKPLGFFSNLWHNIKYVLGGNYKDWSKE